MNAAGDMRSRGLLLTPAGTDSELAGCRANS